MSPDPSHQAAPTRRIQGYCALCVSRCGSVAVVEGDRLLALEPDPSHPTGRALCAKGRAAPELVHHPDRLLYPLARTRPKADPEAGWRRISWDEALTRTAEAMQRIAREHGPESVAFSAASPSTSALDDSLHWIGRLMAAYGTPNLCYSTELCGWGRYGATRYTFGASVPGAYMPDIENAGCIVLWGYNPNLARLTHASDVVRATKRGARLIVVDPRATAPARRADVWLQVRPGTDAALALGLAHAMIAHDWFDRDFVRSWTDGPLLVRDDDGRRLTEADLRVGGSPERFVAWGDAAGGPVALDAGDDASDGSLLGRYRVPTLHGAVACTPVFQLVADACARYAGDAVEAATGVAASRVEEAARLLWEARPTAYYAWSGVEMQAGATAIARAIAQVYALTGSLDAPGGNVLFAAPAEGDLSPDVPRPARPALGLEQRPLGPARFGHVNTRDLYRAILDGEPYPVRGLVGFGHNVLLSHADGARGRRALAALDFSVHADLFMTPTAAMADIVLPVASAFETEALKLGFVSSADAQRRVQLRPAVVPPRGEARSDTQIVFSLATALGLGEHFWQGDVDEGQRQRLRTSGVTLEQLRAAPGGIDLPLATRYRKYAEREGGTARAFATPSRRIELYSQTMLEHGHPPLPTHEPPPMSPRARPDLSGRFPLVLTCAKHTLFCESQHRALPSLRRLALEPEVELHPSVAASRGIADGDWVAIATPKGSVRARARLDASLLPDVVCAQHGWWQGCEAIGAPGYDPFGPEGANLNLIIGDDVTDPVSASVPHRAYLCDVHKVES